MTQPTIVHVGIDESGSLPAPTGLFTLAAVVTPNPEAVQNLIRRTAFHSGKNLGHGAKNVGELKWSNASYRIRQDVLQRIAASEVQLFALIVEKEQRRVEDSAENYAFLVCELLSAGWQRYPNMTVLLDRHFTSPAHVATVDTIVHRHWPRHGVVSINHVDSQRNPLVQLADFVAGCVYEWNSAQDDRYRLIEHKFHTVVRKHWTDIKAEWVEKDKQKTKPPE